ncbi:mechanosensitive ion channel domain-containing protein [Salinisphaera sp.]|uniref:mechanosensitive ion channel domain-containing protein n=1 Tax=Salinisphaera sp. TaxID=1914330 RepID=UPI002D778799|nr:mechanosensitive ion channel domain-containing protein [Salinisphaera sp.]HET7313281.1 mechanosensitive ion channel domain-containing protein [Salinisphaera sp.]
MDYYRASSSRVRVVRSFIGYALICLCLVAPVAGAATSSSQPPEGSQQSVSLDQLADLLANDKTRNQLIQELRQAANKEQGGKSTAAPPAAAEKGGAPAADNAAKTQAIRQVPEHRQSFARQFAQTTAAWSEAAVSVVAAGWHRVAALVSSGNRGPTGAGIAWGAFFQSAVMFAIVAAATVVSFLVLRLLAGALFSRIARLPERAATRRATFVRRTTAVTVGILVDVAVVFIAGGVGYAVGLYGIGDNGAMGTRQSLFINAFVLIELVKVVIRALFADRYDNLRLLRMTPAVAAWWSIRLRWFIGVIGYAQLVVVPILNVQINYLVGAVVTFIVMAAAYIYALTVIFGNRRLLTRRLRDMADNASLGFFSVLYRLFARIWVFLALAYFTTLFVVSQLYPQQALPAMLWATVQTLIAAVVCLGLSGLLSRIIGRRVHFSDSMRDRMPMLEARLNSYVPSALKVVRVVILIIFVAVTLTIWGIFNFSEWLATDIGIRIVGAAIHVALIVVAAAVLWVIVASLIEHRMSPNTGHGAPTARQQTLLSLFRNAVAILIVGFTVLICLSQIGVNIGPLIAGAGVFGLAIGFGAQKMVQDIITGVFIQLENAMNTGDVVNLSGTWGTVERLTIRSVSLRDIDGGFHIIPFSSVSVVSNYMREFAYYRFEYRVAYREDIDNVIVRLREAFAELKADPAHRPNILEDMTVPGVTALDESSVKIRIMIKTVAGAQWGVGRAFNRLVKIHFERAGIEIPFPHQTLWFGEDHRGEAPAANIRLLEVDDEDGNAGYRPKRRRRGDDAAPEETGDAPG